MPFARLQLTGRERVLDMCTGTADLAIEAATSSSGQRGATSSASISRPRCCVMARERFGRPALAARVRLARGDATPLPLPDGSFDAATVAFGIRNVLDPEQACREFIACSSPAGGWPILEFGAPRIPGIRRCLLWYFSHVLPLVGRLVSKHGEAYTYLPASVMRVPDGRGVCATCSRPRGSPTCEASR